MTEIPVDVLPRLQTWWMSIDPGMQAMLEAIYMEAPGAVSRVVSGGAWEADSAEPGLAAQLGTDSSEAFDTLQSIPSASVRDLPQVTPFHPGLGQAVTITWTEKNESTADLPAYVTDIYVADSSGNNVGSARLSNEALAAGASAERTWEFAGAQTEGSHTISIYANAEGTDPGSEVPGPQGFRSIAGTVFDAGASEIQAERQDSAAWSTGVGMLYSLGGARPAEALATVQEAVNWLVADEGLSDEHRDSLGRIGDALQRMTQRVEYEPEETVPAESLVTLAGVASMSMNPDEASRARLIGALTTFVGTN